MKIAIVNDMPMAVEALRRAVSVNPGHEVIWVAKDGVEAVAHSARRRPDLILMDLIMPTMNGVEATRRIMSAQPCPILVVTANVGSNAGLVFEAMARGALDAIDTPFLGTGDMRKDAAPLLKKIDDIEQRVAHDKVVRVDDQAEVITQPLPPVGLVAIGASAGGPGALTTVLGGLPKRFKAALVIVQHVDDMFLAGMAEWLNQHSAIPVRLASEGDRLEAGVALLAGAGGHLVLKNANQLGYTPEPRESIYKPSIDVFFRSVCKQLRGHAVGIVLTGMGSDGASGLKSMRDKGHYTIAQDQATSTVYGMPKAAVSLGAAVDILPVQAIAPKLASVFPA
ncbi:MAG: chemotaxis response regulator protein-glutamate methylesterase [Burkholderiales bacterium]|nr:chemotaxis response regulator protein-glutamate methylesterase [Burkholderiales bacterium]